MEFREARSLAMLAKLQSLAKTAQHVHLTPAAVHKQIKNIETEFGVTLYEKDGRNVQVTQAAHVIMPYVEELLAQYDAIAAALTEWKGIHRGFVRIGANPAMSSFLLPSLLKAFREKWPGIAIALDVDISPTLVQRVTNRSLDVAMGLWDDPGQGRVASQLRWEYDIVPVISGLAGRKYTRLRDLSGLPFVRLPQGAVLAAWIDNYLSKYEFHPSEVMVVNNAHTMMSLIRCGLGMGMLPMWAVASEVESGTLTVIRCEEPPLVGTLDLITVKSGYIPPPVKAFIELAREESSWEHVRLLS